MSVIVDSGPAAIVNNAPDNYLYVTVTVCQPGTTTCATVDHVQVSTATTGLRVLATAVTGIALTSVADPNAAGNTLAECYQLPVGTAWGNVVTADLQIGGETAAAVPIQIIATPAATPNPATCTDNGFIRGDQSTGVQELSANGVIGLGTLVQDCTSAATCMNQYFTCKTLTGGLVNCQSNVSAAPSPGVEVTNPVTMFATDKNGVIITLPAVDPAMGAASGPATTGSITFGIGTQANNALGAITVALAADPSTGAITTTYTSLATGAQPVQYTSWFDTGSVPYVFTDAAITPCPGSGGQGTTGGLASFYCPAQPLSLSATVAGAGGIGTGGTVPFTVANAQTLGTTNPTSIAFSSLGAVSEPATSFGGANPFIWGLPFFFGKTVYIAYPSASVTETGGTVLDGPFYAF